jgi:hypothetical protein
VLVGAGTIAGSPGSAILLAAVAQLWAVTFEVASGIAIEAFHSGLIEGHLLVGRPMVLNQGQNVGFGEISTKLSGCSLGILGVSSGRPLVSVLLATVLRLDKKTDVFHGKSMLYHVQKSSLLAHVSNVDQSLI